MRAFINKKIARLKGGDYAVDERVPAAYLLWLLAGRAVMWIRGACSCTRNKGMLFIGSNVCIKSRRNIFLGRGVTIDRDCFIDALSTEGVTMGNNVSLGKSITIACTGNLQNIGKGLRVGNNVGLGAGNFFGCAGGIEIGDDTIMGNFISCHSENHNFGNTGVLIRQQGVTRAGIVIGKNCWIGSGVTILDGANIADGCVIAAGAVLIAGQYEPNAVYGGVPAKFIKKRGEG